MEKASNEGSEVKINQKEHMFRLEFGMSYADAVERLDEMLANYAEVLKKRRIYDEIKHKTQEETDESLENSYRQDYYERFCTELQHRLYGTFDYDRLLEGIKKAKYPEEG